MNRDTEIFVKTKELEVAQREFIDSLEMLNDVLSKVNDVMTKAAAKLEKAAKACTDLLK